jgi:hypothetical protein
MFCSFDTLMGPAQTVFDQDSWSGHLFLLFNRDRNRVKNLFWDQDGFGIGYKKPEADYPHFFLFAEIGEGADNLACRPGLCDGLQFFPDCVALRTH